MMILRGEGVPWNSLHMTQVECCVACEKVQWPSFVTIHGETMLSRDWGMELSGPGHTPNWGIAKAAWSSLYRMHRFSAPPVSVDLPCVLS